MRLEAFITDLLYEHDCVAIPGFGGLVANYRNARLNRHSHIIYPPSKHIGFNKNLTNNDGLLVHHLSAAVGISYAQASERVAEMVAQCQQQLNADGRLVWEKIGVFFRDKAGQIQFIPEEQENYLLSSFGLRPVQLKYVEQRIVKDEVPVIPISAAPKRTAVWKIAVAATIPLLIGGTLILRNAAMNQGGFNLASINPFGQLRIQSLYEPRPAESTGFVIVPITEDPIAESYENTDSSSAKVNGLDAENQVSEAIDNHRETESEPEVRQNLKGKHAVIGGAFKVKSNAERFLKKLKAEGFDAKYAGTKDGLTLVAYGVYDSATEADTAIQNILSASDTRAWVKHF